MKKAIPTRRKRYLIDRKIQGGLGVRLAMHWGLFLALTLLLNFALRAVSNVEHASFVELIQIVAREQAAATFIILALLPWFINDSIKLTHRFVGPIQRIRSAMKQLTSQDDVQPVVLRKGDFFGEVANDFNTLRTRVLTDRKALAESRQPVPQVASHLRDTVTMPLSAIPLAMDGLSGGASSVPTGCN